MKGFPTIKIISLAVFYVTLHSCAAYQFRTNYNTANSLVHSADYLQTNPFLKVHLRNGDICIMRDSWKLNTTENTLDGAGVLYDFNRNTKFEGDISIPLDSAVIFETNTKIENPENARIAALSILTGADLVMGIVCISNPKACYGSCPTFYLDENSSFRYADAEGFSNAIFPSMEYADIDDLKTTATKGQRLSLFMRNEALETHCVEDISLMVFPKNSDETIYHSQQDEFYKCRQNYPVSSASINSEDITHTLSAADGIERYSLSDAKDLVSKEEIYVDFHGVDGIHFPGLVIDYRQTLMTTYFIYNAIGYMGDEVGDIFAGLEMRQDKIEQLNNGLKKALGNIDLYLWDESCKSWVFQGGIYETGPIAYNRQIIPIDFTDPGSDIHLKLVMNKGLWAIDYLALTDIIGKVQPRLVPPVEILKEGIPDIGALEAIRSEAEHLISMPGSRYEIIFDLPEDDQDYQLFLCVKGYYLEWMRQDWLDDKNLRLLRLLVEKPEQYLKKVANDYHRYEESMVEDFWNSRIDTDNYTSNDE